MTVVTRFPPSPTGDLHIGSVRTALFSWLYARHCGGRFLLRMEDTDRARSHDAHVQSILEGLSWLGLDYDGDVLLQSERVERHQHVVKQLLETGHAYRCVCSSERLEKLRAEQMARLEKPRYDGRCRDLDLEEPHDESFVVRFRNPLDGVVSWEDAVRGPIAISNTELDDLVILRRGGHPTYNLAVVVDDSDAGVTHVIRGDDHINNTPRQINLMTAMGLSAPTYAHIPMILGQDGKRLSKRYGADGVLNLRQQGFLPQAVLNYLVRMGWSHGDQEIFSLKEMIDFFDLTQISASAAAVNTEKLLWLNQHYIQKSSVEDLASELRWHLQNQGVVLQMSEGPAIEQVVEVMRTRAKTLYEMAQKSLCFYQAKVHYDPEAQSVWLTSSRYTLLTAFHHQLKNMQDWSLESLKKLIQTFLEQHQLKMPQLAQPLRVALTGTTQSPSIDATLFLMGQPTTLARIQQALEMIENKQ